MTSMAVTDKQICDAIAGILESRQPPATICPSEAARALEPNEWRLLMPRVRTVAIGMAKDGVLDIRQGGRTVVPDEPLRGPIRLGRPTPGTVGHPTAPDGR